MWKIIALIFLILAFGLGYFIMENSAEKIIVTFIGTQYSTALGIGLSIAFAAGAVFMFLVSLVSEMRLRGHIRKLKKSHQKMQNDLLAVKNFSVSNEEK